MEKAISNLFRVYLTLFCIFCFSSLFANGNEEKKWVGTWACAPYAVDQSNTPPMPLSNNTLRQVVRVSIGGDTVRLKLSNISCSTPVTIKAVNLAASKGGSAIDPATITPLTFNGNATVTINAKSEVTSDPAAFKLTPSMRVAITIYYGQCQSSADMTGHVGSRTDSYILTGDKTTDATFSGATVVAHWYTISAIDVLAPKNAGAVAVLGNSITDGYGLSGGKQNRWTDIFSERLLQNPTTQWVGVLNLGIGGTNVASGNNSGLSRYKRDILEQSGVKWFIIFYGVNDINANASANTIIDAYKKMAADAHQKNIKVYCATLTPFNGHSYYTPEHESVRVAVNTWIRTNKDVIDGYIDFDKAVRDPKDTTRFRAELKNDWLHPNEEGYKVLGQSVDLKLFEDELGIFEVSNKKIKEFKIQQMKNFLFLELPYPDEYSMKIFSLHGKKVLDTQGKYSQQKIVIDLSKIALSNGIFSYVVNTRDGFSKVGKIVMKK